MYAPAELLKRKSLVPAHLSPYEICAAILQLATDLHSPSAPDYYLQCLGAIRISAQLFTARK